MIEILNRCDDIVKTTPPNPQCHNTNTSCFDCMRNNFYSANRDTYDCLIKLAHYTINYGQIYVSEIYHFLNDSQFLETNFRNFLRPINVMSLGCGFGPDDIALNKYRNDKQLPINFNYYGYDKEPLWNCITQTNALPITHDLLNSMNFQVIDILFINKLFSTLKNHSLNQIFLNIFQNSLQFLPTGSFVVFNDINHQGMGRDEFDNFAQQNSLKVVGKYYFDVENAFNGGYIKIQSNLNIYPPVPPTFSYSPKPTVNKSIFFLYQKVQSVVI